MEKVFKIHVDLHLQTFFSSIFICILGGISLSCLPLNCHYHQIGFALKQVVPVSYYTYTVPQKAQSSLKKMHD